MSNPIPVPPVPPAGLKQRLDAMALAEIEQFLDVIRAQVKLVVANPPKGRQPEIDELIAAHSLAEQVSGDKHQAAQPLPVAADTVLTQAIAGINQEINQGGNS